MSVGVGSHVFGLEVLDPEGFETLDAYLDACGVEHFSAWELTRIRSIGVTVDAPPRRLWPRIVPALGVAEELRRRMGCPLVVGSGYRPLRINAQVKGSKRSQHIQFRAVDLDLPNRVAADREQRIKFACHAVELWKVHSHRLEMGLGLYSSPGAYRVHVDCGHRARRWYPRHHRRVEQELAARYIITQLETDRSMNRGA